MRSTNRKPLALLGLLVLATAILAGTERAMPSGGLWKVITLQIKTAVGGAVQATVTHDGTDVVFSDSIKTTNVTATGTITVTGAQTFTGATALNGGAVLANTKDLTCATDGGSDIGASGTEFGTAWVSTLDDGDGTVAVAANLDVTAGTVALGSNVPTMATSRTVWIWPEDFKLPGSNPATVGAQDGGATLVFADSTTDDHAFFRFTIPDDFDRTNSGLTIDIVSNLPSGTPAEGLWNLECLGVSDGDADAAPSTGYTTTVYQLHSGNDKNDVTDNPARFNSGELAVGAGTLALNCNLYHDVAFAFGGDVSLVGMRIGYTTDKNY